MKRNQLEILNVLRTTANIQAASKIVGKNASNISRAIKSLEEELGCALYVYRDMKIAITPEGKMVCEYGEIFLKTAASLDRWALSQTEETRKEISAKMNWSEQEIRYLLVIKKSGNLSRAAEELYVSQPSLSQFLSKLGKWCGGPLYSHENNHLALNPRGEELYHYIEEMNLPLQKIHSDLEEFYEMRRGTVKFGITTNIGLSLIPLIVPAFLKRFPDIKVRVRENPSIELKRLLKANRIDFCILHEEDLGTPDPHDPDIQYPFHYEEELKLVIPKRWEERLQLPEDRPLNAADLLRLRNENYVLVAKKTPLRNTIERIFSNVRKQTQVEYEPSACCSAKNVEIIKRLVRGETGISFLPESELRIHTENSTMLSYSLAPELQARWILALALPREDTLSRCSRELIDVVKEILKEEYKSSGTA